MSILALLERHVPFQIFVFQGNLPFTVAESEDLFTNVQS